MDQRISIIIPAYNEEVRLASGIETIVKHFETEKIKGEIIVVDDGSNDATAVQARKSLARSKSGITTQVIRCEQNRGKGYAVRTGLLAASGGIALFSDADLSTPISEMEKLVAPIRFGAVDVAFGSRALDRNLIETHQPWRREQGGKVFNLVVRAFTQLPFWDTQCGFKAIRTKLFRPILKAAQIDRFGFDVEFLLVAHQAGLRLREIPVRWNHSEGSKVSVFRDSVRMFNEVREVRRNLRRGVYDPAIVEIKLLQKQKPERAMSAAA